MISKDDTDPPMSTKKSETPVPDTLLGCVVFIILWCGAVFVDWFFSIGIGHLIRVGLGALGVVSGSLAARQRTELSVEVDVGEDRLLEDT